MANFMLFYMGGNMPKTPEEGEAHFKKYQQWLLDLGDAVVSAVNPLARTHHIQSDGTVGEGSAMAMSGFSILQANSIEEAVGMAANCPFLEIGGSLEVAEMVQTQGMGTDRVDPN